MEVNFDSRSYLINKTSISTEDISGRLDITGYYPFPLCYSENGHRFRITHKHKEGLTIRNLTTKETTFSITYVEDNQFSGYGGCYKGLHIFLLKVFDAKVPTVACGMVLLDTRDITKTRMIYFKHIYDFVCFDRSGKILALPHDYHTKKMIHVLRNNSGRVEREIPIPQFYENKKLLTSDSSFLFAPGYIYFFQHYPSRVITYDLDYECFVGTITNQTNEDILVTTHQDLTSTFWTKKGESFDDYPAYKIEKLDRGHMIYGMTVGLCDGYFKISTKTIKESFEKREKAKRFFKMIERLPLELQMIVCNKMGANHHKDTITAKEFEHLKGRWV